MDTFEELRGAIVDGEVDNACAMVQQQLMQGTAAGVLLNHALIAAMGEVGERFQRQEFFLPEMMLAARAMKSALAVLQPHLSAADVKSRGKVVLATVQGDLHDIGKGLVRVMLEGAGFEVIDLGVDVGPEAIVTAVRQHRPDLVGMSALLTTTMPAMEQTVAALEQAGLRSQVKVIIGGAPVTNVYAQQIGADLYAPDAASAVGVAEQALGETLN